MAKVVSLRPERTRMDRAIDGLFQILPATTHEDIAERLGKYLRRHVKVSEVGRILLHLRNHCDEYGWTVPHAKRGKHAFTEEGFRFFHVLVERGRDAAFDDDHEGQLMGGLKSTTQHAASSIEHESDAIMLASAYCKNPLLRRLLKSIGRRSKQIGEDLREVVDMMRDDDSATA